MIGIGIQYFGGRGSGGGKGASGGGARGASGGASSGESVLVRTKSGTYKEMQVTSQTVEVDKVSKNAATLANGETIGLTYVRGAEKWGDTRSYTRTSLGKSVTVFKETYTAVGSKGNSYIFDVTISNVLKGAATRSVSNVRRLK